MDDVDRKVVSLLQIDGRMTYEELGKQVGLTGVGVKKRVRKMLNHELIRISALLNAEKLELQAAVVLLEMENAEAMRRIIERFKNCPRVVQIFSTIGGYNLIAFIVAEDRGTLESVSMEKCSLRSSEGIRRSEFYPVGKVHYAPFLQVRQYLAHKGRQETPCSVDCRPCESFHTGRCVACPATMHYRGSL